MDEPVSPQERQTRKRRRGLLAGGAGLLAALAIYALTRVGEAAPLVPTDGLWIDAVQEGDISREVHGVGELVPDDDAARWAAADVDGRVERKLLESGALVAADTVLLELSDPDVAQAAVTADLALEQAASAYTSLEASLEAELLSVRSLMASVESERAQAVLQARVDATLAKKGLLSEVTAEQSSVRADALTERARLEQSRLAALEQSQRTRLAAQQSEVKNHRTMADLKRRDLAALTVRAGMRGVLQDVVVEVGQRVTRGANLARVIDPARLKARIRVPEAQTTALQLGQAVNVDTHNGIVPGRLSRIAPSAENGTVAVDVRLDGALPAGARVDMTIDGTIHLNQLSGIRHVSRPASGPSEGDAFLYKVSADGTRAERITVRLGPATANRVQIVDGDLSAGDRVVLSDTSGWPDAAVVRLQ